MELTSPRKIAVNLALVSPIIPYTHHAPVTIASIRGFFATFSCIRVMELMGASSAADIVSEEFGDGNLNLVFRCRCAKSARSYVF